MVALMGPRDDLQRLHDGINDVIGDYCDQCKMAPCVCPPPGRILDGEPKSLCKRPAEILIREILNGIDGYVCAFGTEMRVRRHEDSRGVEWMIDTGGPECIADTFHQAIAELWVHCWDQSRIWRASE